MGKTGLPDMIGVHGTSVEHNDQENVSVHLAKDVSKTSKVLHRKRSVDDDAVIQLRAGIRSEQIGTYGWHRELVPSYTQPTWKHVHAPCMETSKTYRRVERLCAKVRHEQTDERMRYYFLSMLREIMLDPATDTEARQLAALTLCDKK